MNRYHARRSGICALFLALHCIACAAVELPQECYYRLDCTNPAPVAVAARGILRIEDFALSAALDGDRLLVSERPGQLRAYELHRWISPLDRLVQEAVRQGMQASGAWAEVKTAVDPGGADLVLHGRVLDFHQIAAAGRWVGQVRLELRLSRASDQVVVLRRSFEAAVPLAGDGSDEESVATPAGLAAALADGTAQVLQQFLTASRRTGVFGDLARPGK